MSHNYKRWYDHDPVLLEVINLLQNYQNELKSQAEIFLAEVEKKVREKYGLPTSVQIAQEELLEAMTHDKKCDSEGVKIVLPEAIGKCGIYRL